MSKKFNDFVNAQLTQIREDGLYKSERIISSQQSSCIKLENSDQPCINFCANNYLGLANNPRLIKTAQQALDQYGFGMASVRFICGTQSPHKQLEARIADFLGMEDSILYVSCFDANAGLFETLLDEEDAIISDTLNHASIIDGVRLCKAKRYRYANNDMAELEACLQKAQAARHRLIATDGVFSMDGSIANLQAICDLADQYDAMVMVDDSHAVGFMGETGAGTPEHCGVKERVDIITGTLGKALGGASGGYTAASKVVVDLLRQRSRPYLFSNTLSPSIAVASIEVLDILQESGELRRQLWDNVNYFRQAMIDLGFTIKGKDHPIVPVMIGDAQLAHQMASRLLDEGIYVIGFSFPVVPRGEARIRLQVSASHSREDLDKTLAAFEKIGKEFNLI